MTFRLTGISSLLKRHGRNLKVTKASGEVYDPQTSTVTNQSEPFFVRGYFYDSRELNIYDTQIGEGNRRVVLYPYGLEGLPIPKPEIGDRIEGQRDTVSIWRVEEVMSKEKVLAYICRVKE